MTSTEIALLKNLRDIVAEYDQKRASAANAVKLFAAAGDALKASATLGGIWGDVNLDTGSVHERSVRESLLKSAWRHVYAGLNIERIASATDKRKWEQSLASPAAFTLDNIRATFGHYIQNPRINILRGLAEVFCDLDPAYKSHDKVKIGVKGLPKRIIINIGSGYGWGKDRLENVLNALAAYQGKPLTTWTELQDLLKNENALKESRGIHLKRFTNGNAHLHFLPDTLRDINLALSEFYGEVLPDDSEEKPAQKAPGTTVAKDLQYYPTPVSVVERVIADLHCLKGERVLEPSCGCGRFLDGLRKAGASVYGIEYDPNRANIARSKGHAVLTANFLDTVPTGDFDRVVMNPPFCGKHYAKHVNHALKFLKPGARLTAILPATARYDHGLLDGRWEDLPVGSFSESGTNINTTVLTLCKAEEALASASTTKYEGASA